MTRAQFDRWNFGIDFKTFLRMDLIIGRDIETGELAILKNRQDDKTGPVTPEEASNYIAYAMENNYDILVVKPVGVLRPLYGDG